MSSKDRCWKCFPLLIKYLVGKINNIDPKAKKENSSLSVIKRNNENPSICKKLITRKNIEILSNNLIHELLYFPALRTKILSGEFKIKKEINILDIQDLVVDVSFDRHIDELFTKNELVYINKNYVYSFIETDAVLNDEYLTREFKVESSETKPSTKPVNTPEVNNTTAVNNSNNTSSTTSGNNNTSSTTVASTSTTTEDDKIIGLDQDVFILLAIGCGVLLVILYLCLSGNGKKVSKVVKKSIRGPRFNPSYLRWRPPVTKVPSFPGAYRKNWKSLIN